MGAPLLFIDSHVDGFCDSCHLKIKFFPCTITFSRPIYYDGLDRMANITLELDNDCFMLVMDQINFSAFQPKHNRLVDGNN